MDGESITLLTGVVVNIGLWASIWYKMGRVEVENKHVTDFLKRNCPHCHQQVVEKQSGKGS